MSEETLGHMMIRELQEEKAALRARVAELEAEARVKRISAPPPPPRSRAMPEQGPTEAEVTLIFGGPKPKSMDCQCSGSSVQCRAHQWRAAEAVALKLDALTRARHVREAVEEADNTALLSLPCTCGEDGDVDVRAFRAALLDALTGEGM